jgi:hypothetical protein
MDPPTGCAPSSPKESWLNSAKAPTTHTAAMHWCAARGRRIALSENSRGLERVDLAIGPPGGAAVEQLETNVGGGREERDEVDVIVRRGAHRARRHWLGDRRVVENAKQRARTHHEVGEMASRKTEKARQRLREHLCGCLHPREQSRHRELELGRLDRPDVRDADVRRWADVPELLQVHDRRILRLLPPERDQAAGAVEVVITHVARLDVVGERERCDRRRVRVREELRRNVVTGDLDEPGLGAGPARVLPGLRS